MFMYIRVFRHLVFVYSVRSVFSCQPWGNNMHNDARYALCKMYFV